MVLVIKPYMEYVYKT